MSSTFALLSPDAPHRMLFELMQKTSEDQKNYSRSENFNKMLLTIMMMFEVMQNLYDMLRYLMIGADKTERFLADECEEPRRMKSFQSFPKLKKNEPESRPHPPHPVLRLADKEQNDWESFVVQTVRAPCSVVLNRALMSIVRPKN